MSIRESLLKDVERMVIDPSGLIADQRRLLTAYAKAAIDLSTGITGREREDTEQISSIAKRRLRNIKDRVDANVWITDVDNAIDAVFVFESNKRD